MSITPEVARAVRDAYAAGEKQKDIGDRFGLSQASVSLLVTGRIWPEAGGPITLRHRKVTAVDVVAIRAAYARNGVTQKELAVEYGIDRATVGQIVRGDAWKRASGPITRMGSGRRLA